VAGARAGVGDASAALALAEAVARLREAGFVACSWLSSAEAALSVFARVAGRLRVVAGFACTLASGDSDGLFIKKTPFYRMICHSLNIVRAPKIGEERRFVTEISFHSHIKRTVPS
jgi:hypothetical protein